MQLDFHLAIRLSIQKLSLHDHSFLFLFFYVLLLLYSLLPSLFVNNVSFRAWRRLSNINILFLIRCLPSDWFLFLEFFNKTLFSFSTGKYHECIFNILLKRNGLSEFYCRNYYQMFINNLRRMKIEIKIKKK